MDVVAIVVGTLAAFFIGGLWYGPLFQKLWMKENNFSEDYLAKRNLPVVFGLSLVIFLVSTILLSMFIGSAKDLGLTLVASMSVGFWSASSLGVIYLFEKRSLKLFLINGGYLFLSFFVIGLVLYFL